MASKQCALVVAATESWGIGKGGTLPWRLKGDMAYFKKLTSGASEGKKNAVIMGRKTWESIPEKFRPLRGRVNYVLTRSPESVSVSDLKDVHVTTSLPEAIDQAANSEEIENIFIIGGATIYLQAMDLPLCNVVYMTKVFHNFDCDTFMPDIVQKGFAADTEYSPERVEEGEISYEYQKYTRGEI